MILEERLTVNHFYVDVDDECPTINDAIFEHNAELEVCVNLDDGMASNTPCENT